MIPITHIFYSILLGLILGFAFGTFGLFSLTVLVVGLPWFGLVSDQKNMLGTIALVSSFPFSLAVLYKYNKEGKVNWTVGLIIALSLLIGSYLASTFVLNKLKDADVKFYRFIYITTVTGFFYYQYFFT
jgi:uncharacterized membrane protein YfcA